MEQETLFLERAYGSKFVDYHNMYADLLEPKRERYDMAAHAQYDMMVADDKEKGLYVDALIYQAMTVRVFSWRHVRFDDYWKRERWNENLSRDLFPGVKTHVTPNQRFHLAQLINARLVELEDSLGWDGMNLLYTMAREERSPRSSRYEARCELDYAELVKKVLKG